MPMKVFPLILFLVRLLSSTSLIHNLVITNDDRDFFKIETFGFFQGGRMDITVADFMISSKSRISSASSSLNFRGGFIMRKADSETAAQQDMENMIEKGMCMIDAIQQQDFFIDMSNSSVWSGPVKHERVISDEEVGLYSLIFVRCNPSGTGYIEQFRLQATFQNPGPNYLSAGDAPLPVLYFSFFIAFSLALVTWCFILYRPAGKVHQIHYLMAVLLLLKCLTLLFESVRFHFISLYGSSETWSIIYYIFAFCKGIMLFSVILLIGSGWSLMKPFLNDQEKRIIMVVLTLQVIDNIAMVILEETSPGTQLWLAWRDVLHLVDIVCCCCILFPIVWSIRHLRQAAEIDGKANINLKKLQLFRHFYIMVVVYVYFTRIVVLLIAATIPFYLLWLGDFSVEFATLLFFVITGSQFRPSPENPYIEVEQDDLGTDRSSELGTQGRAGGEGALSEYGLEDGDEHEFAAMRSPQTTIGSSGRAVRNAIAL